MKKMADDLNLPSESFCILPWVQLYADTEGNLRPCPLAIRDEQAEGCGANVGPETAYGPEGVEGAWNAPLMKTMRREMLAGKRPAACRYCFRDEDLGVQHYRRDFNREFRDHVDEAAASTSEDGASPVNLIRKIDLYLGNSCNLRCRMCSPVASKALIPEWAELGDEQEQNPRLEQLQHLDWFTGNDLWRAIENHVSHIDRLHFAGGEPMLIPQMFEILERVIALGKARDITLSYNSNLTLLPRRLFDLWSHFKGVRVTASIDGFGEVNSFIRYPSHWPTIENNLRELDAGWKELSLQSLSLNVTVQVYNIFRLDELLEYAATSFAHLAQPNLSLLSQPDHLDIRILPPDMKESAAARLRSFARRFAGRWPERWHGRQVEELLAALDGIISYMKSDDRSRLIPEFRRWCEHQDQFRGHHVLNVMPELAPLFARPFDSD